MSKYKIKDVRKFADYQERYKTVYNVKQILFFEDEEMSEFFKAKEHVELDLRDKYSLRKGLFSLVAGLSAVGALVYTLTDCQQDFFDKYMKAIFCSSFALLGELYAGSELIPYLKHNKRANNFGRLSKLAKSRKFNSYVKKMIDKGKV